MREKSRAIVVLGVHRSGTSMLTGALDLLGVDLGRRFLPENEWNERGHFELAEVVRIDNELLRLAGKLWDCIELPPYADIAARTAPLAAAAKNFLTEEFAGSALWGLKDPRMCRLLPFWQDVFAALGAADAYVLVLRNPLSVARSLERRDGFATEKSCLLWLQHMRAAVAGIRGRRAVVVDYDRFLEEPVGELERMATQLKLTVRPEMATDLPRYCARLVDTSLRHGTFDDAALYGDARVPDSVKDLYRALKMVARELAGLPALAERTARAETSGADYPWLARALPFVEGELVRARAGLAELTAEIAEARRSHTGRDAIEAALRDQIARAERDIAAERARAERDLAAERARAERDLADERATIASLTQQLDFARVAAEGQLQEIATARANIDALVGEIEVARAGADIQNQQIEAARSHIEALGEEIAVARAGAEDQQRQIEAAQNRIEALVSRIEDASRSAAERARRESELRTDVVRLAEEAGVLRSERDALAPALRETQEAAATIAADRDRLVQLERGARERSALLDGRIAALESDVRATRARDEVNAAELSRLSRTWYGRLARRLARPR